MPAEGIDLSRPRRVHVVGIGGAGMSGLARILAGLGHHVSGSDLVASAAATSLRDVGIDVSVGHAAAHVTDAEIVTASPAVTPQNEELQEAHRRGLQVASRAEVLAAVCARRATLAVAGTHGKTTTSSMLALILERAGHAPSWLVGADVAGLGANARLGTGPELVLEADESYGAFALLEPAVVALTNVEVDHLDHYGTESDLHLAFAGLLERAESRVVWADDPVAARLGAAVGALRVGTADCDVEVRDVRLSRASSSFVLHVDGAAVELHVGAPGRHNVANAALAATVATQRGVSGTQAADALAGFAGVPRRFEFRGEALGATLVDDYAHLPAEVRATLAAARAGAWPRIVAVFQPHRYTRTASVSAQFAAAFDDADVVVVTDVYAAGEPPAPGVTGRLVVDAITGAQGAPEVHYVKDRARLAAAVAALVRPGDLVVTMGAGDLTTLADELRDGAP